MNYISIKFFFNLLGGSFAEVWSSFSRPQKLQGEEKAAPQTCRVTFIGPPPPSAAHLVVLRIEGPGHFWGLFYPNVYSLKTLKPFEPAAPVLEISPGEPSSCRRKHLYSKVFHAAFSVVLKKTRNHLSFQKQENSYVNGSCAIWKRGLETLTNTGKWCSCEVRWRGQTRNWGRAVGSAPRKRHRVGEAKAEAAVLEGWRVKTELSSLFRLEVHQCQCQ